MTISTGGPGAPFDAVLCDIDDVIRSFDMTEVERLEQAAGLPEGSTVAAGLSAGLGDRLVLGRLTREEWAAATAAALAGRTGPDTARELAEAFTRTPFRVDPEVVELLGRARAHCPVVLVTNGAPWLDEELPALGLDDLADAVVNSSRVGVAKPDPGIYLLAAQQAGAAPERCLFVDDRQRNVDAAAALGMTVVHYRTPADLREALAPLLARPAPVPAPAPR